MKTKGGIKNMSQQTPYYYPTSQYMRMPAMTGMDYPVYPQPPLQNQPAVLKGRPVVSIEEARAAQIDLDGTLHVFTDIGNQKIYTKQLNIDGTATLNVYELVEEPVVPMQNDYVTKEEFERAVEILKAQISQLKLGGGAPTSTPATAAEKLNINF
jgi:hypothetical protein